MRFGTYTLVTSLFLAVALVVSVAGVSVAAYPERDIEMVAWASPGGGSDIMCRTFAKAAEGIIPKTMYVVNKSGGGGAVGMTYIQGKAADGYTLLGVTNNLVFTPLSTPDFKYSYKDFEPIIMWGYDPKCIAVSASSPHKTIEDFVKAAKASPGKLKIGTFGPGTDDHVLGFVLGKTAGTSFGFVPFDSGGEILAALLGGHIDAQVTEVAEVKGQVDAGKVRILAVATQSRVAEMPSVPTFKEKGWDVVFEKFRGVMVKKGTPPDVVTYLIDKSKQLVKTKVFEDYNKANLIVPYVLTGPDFGEVVKKQNEQVAPVLKELGLSK